jgi:hypothetical protein
MSFLVSLRKNTDEKISYEFWTTNQKSFTLWTLGYYLWVFVGIIFTFQWFIFLGLFLISFIKKKTVLFRKIDSIITLIILLDLE